MLLLGGTRRKRRARRCRSSSLVGDRSGTECSSLHESFAKPLRVVGLVSGVETGIESPRESRRQGESNQPDRSSCFRSGFPRSLPPSFAFNVVLFFWRTGGRQSIPGKGGRGRAAERGTESKRVLSSGTWISGKEGGGGGASYFAH